MGLEAVVKYEGLEYAVGESLKQVRKMFGKLGAKEPYDIVMENLTTL